MVQHARTRAASPIVLEQLAAKLAEAEGTSHSHDELRAIALELGGEFDLDAENDPGRTVWRFRRLAAELAAPRARDEKLVKVSAAALVDSGEG
jgi:hypothetical protein